MQENCLNLLALEGKKAGRKKGDLNFIRNTLV